MMERNIIAKQGYPEKKLPGLGESIIRPTVMIQVHLELTVKAYASRFR